MTTIDEVRDMLFYILRKLNDFLVDLTTEIPQSPQPPPPPTPRNPSPNREDINTRIERLRMRLQPPPPIIEGAWRNEEEREEEWQRVEKEKEEHIKDLEKRINIKETVLNYLLSRLIKLRELKADNNIIMELEDEFEKLRLERQKLEENLVNVKKLKRN